MKRWQVSLETRRMRLQSYDSPNSDKDLRISFSSEVKSFENHTVYGGFFQKPTCPQFKIRLFSWLQLIRCALSEENSKYTNEY